MPIFLSRSKIQAGVKIWQKTNKFQKDSWNVINFSKASIYSMKIKGSSQIFVCILYLTCEYIWPSFGTKSKLSQPSPHQMEMQSCTAGSVNFQKRGKF